MLDLDEDLGMDVAKKKSFSSGCFPGYHLNHLSSFAPSPLVLLGEGQGHGHRHEPVSDTIAGGRDQQKQKGVLDDRS